MIAALAGLLLPIGAVAVALHASGLRTSRHSSLVTLAMAICLGIGLASLLTFWTSALSLPIDGRFAVVDAMVWATIMAVALGWFRSRRDRSPSPSPPQPPQPPLTTADWLARAAFAVVATLAVATIVSHYRTAPHGEWDAWAIWNQKARFIVREVDYWTDMIAIRWSNPGHPFLVSLSVARLWAYAQAEATAIPALLGAAWGIGIVAAVVGALDTRRPRAWIAGALVMAPAVFTSLAAAQTADLAVGLFMVTAFACVRPIVLSNVPAVDPRALFVAGLVAGCGAWTKNEGLLFSGACSLLVAWAAWRHQRPKELAWWLAGLAPLMATVAWFKLVMAPVPPEYMSGTQGDIQWATFIFDASRHSQIASAAWSHWLSWGGPMATGILPLTMAIVGSRAVLPSGGTAKMVVAVIAPMLCGYYLIWLVAPLDTVWLVNTTFDRLLIQLWPMLVLAAFSEDNRMMPAPAADLIS